MRERGGRFFRFFCVGSGLFWDIWFGFALGHSLPCLASPCLASLCCLALLCSCSVFQACRLLAMIPSMYHVTDAPGKTIKPSNASSALWPDDVAAGFYHPDCSCFVPPCVCLLLKKLFFFCLVLFFSHPSLLSLSLSIHSGGAGVGRTQGFLSLMQVPHLPSVCGVWVPSVLSREWVSEITFPRA